MKPAKRIIIIPDGMADRPLEQLDGRTPLEYADTPAMDDLARRSLVGLVSTVPEGVAPGSDTANLAILSYDPARYYRGRASLEAWALEAPIGKDQYAFRLNLVTLEDSGRAFEQKRLLDFTAGEVDSGVAAELLADLEKAVGNSGLRIYLGAGYHHIATGPDVRWSASTPPHDMMGQPIAAHLQCDRHTAAFMKEAHAYLSAHPLNNKLASMGKAQANGIWIWGAGRGTSLPDFRARTGYRGAVITATDVVSGLARCAGLDLIPVTGADGSLCTNYHGKAAAAVQALVEDYDFVYVHIEAPDAASHAGNLAGKIGAIEQVDRNIVGAIRRELERRGMAYRMLVLPDHPTPLSLRTHTSDPVPFLLYDSACPGIRNDLTFSERQAELGGVYFHSAQELFQHFMSPEREAPWDQENPFAKPIIGLAQRSSPQMAPFH